MPSILGGGGIWKCLSSADPPLHWLGEDTESALQMGDKQAALTAMGMYQVGLDSVANNIINKKGLW